MRSLIVFLWDELKKSQSPCCDGMQPATHNLASRLWKSSLMWMFGHRAGGSARYRLAALLRDELEEIFPEDAHERLNAWEGGVCVGITKLTPLPRGIVNFDCNADVHAQDPSAFMHTCPLAQ